MVKIFVYGSLKNGQYNHSIIEDQKFLGESVLKNARIYNLGSYPGINPSDNETDVVYGELYEIDEDIKGRIDAMERGAGYKCVTKEFKLNGSVIKADVYYYIGKLPEENRINSGVW